MRVRAAMFLSFATLGLSGAAVGQFVNGGFESGDFTGWTVANTAGGAGAPGIVESFDIDWAGPLGMSLAGRFSVGRANAQQTGNQGITLTQSMFLSAGQTYEFAFEWSTFRFTTLQNNQGGIFDLIVNGASIAHVEAGPSGSTTPRFGTLTGMFTPGASGMFDVGAMITRPFTVPTEPLYQYVDNFRVVPSPGAGVLLGMAGLAGVRRRR